MKKYVFLNYVYTNKDNKELTLAQIIKKDELACKVETEVITIEQLKEIYNQAQVDKDLEIDFIFEGDYLKCEDIPNISASKDKLDLISGVTITNEPIITSIYHLFDYLVMNDAYLILTEKDADGNCEIISTSEFIPNFSESTMTVYIPIKTMDGWVSRKLIYVSEGKLVSSKFKFIIDASHKQKIEKDFGLKGTLHKDKVIFEFNGELPIYAYKMDNFQIPNPIVNRSVFESTKYKYCIRMLQLIKTLLLETTQIPTAPETPVKRSSYVSRYTDDCVILKSNYSIDSARLKEILKEALKRYNMLVTGESDAESVERQMVFFTLNVVERTLYAYVFNVMKNGGNTAIDRLEYVCNLLHRVEIRKFKIDNYLYSCVRACLFTMPYRLRHETYEILRGGNVPFNTKIQRKGRL